MTKTFAHKIVLKIVLVLLLSSLGSQHLHARVKNYQYDGDLPFVQMMLDMMVAMGILDRVPVNGIYGGRYGASNSRFGLPWSGIGSNNRNLWGNRGWNNTGWNSNGWRNFGGQNWGLQNLNQDYTNWGQPRWGILPEESYSLNNYPLYGAQTRPPVSSSSDLSGWVNEPWEMSVWNNEKPTKKTSKPTSEQTPATKHEDDPDAVNSNSNIQTEVELKQKACVTDFCGLQGPSLNGLWVSQEGEMLGIKNTNFLWSDGRSRHLSGTIKANNNYLLISADGYQQVMYFKYKIDGNYLITMQPDGKVREFKRTFYERSDSDGYSTYVPSYNDTVIQNDVGAY